MHQINVDLANWVQPHQTLICECRRINTTDKQAVTIRNKHHQIGQRVRAHLIPMHAIPAQLGNVFGRLESLNPSQCSLVPQSFKFRLGSRTREGHLCGGTCQSDEIARSFC